MKTDFSIPNRQNLRGILVLFFMNIIKGIKHNFYVLLPLLSSDFREKYLFTILIVAAVVIVVLLLYSYKSYRNFVFHIEEQRFFLKHGVLRFSKTEIPFDRIQNINIKQNLIQQVLNVVGLEIETAGQNSAEIQIRALKRDVADELKSILLQKAAQQTKVEKEDGSAENIAEEKEIAVETKSPQRVFSLDFLQLIKVGMSSNYLKGFGIMLAFFGTIFQIIEKQFEEYLDATFENMDASVMEGFNSFFAGLFVFIIVVSFLVTVISVVIKYFDLKLTKTGDDYEVEYGLIKRVSQVIKKNKTQVFEVEENPIKDLLKIKNIFVSQASAQELSKKKKIGIVGVSDENLSQLFESLFDLPYPQQFITAKSSYRLLFRVLIKYIVLSLLIGIILYNWQGLMFSTMITSFIFVIFFYVAYKKVQKSFIGVNDDVLQVHGGSIHTINKYVSTYKIQSIVMKRNLFQRRNGHADIIIYTASGQLRIAYLKYAEAKKVVNYLTYKVESSNQSWI